MKLLLAMLVAFALGGSAVAHEIGDKVGTVWVDPGGGVCDTLEQAQQAIDTYDAGQGKIPSGCGIFEGTARALIEVVAMHESSRATYIILKILFLPPSSLGVWYGWQAHSKAPDTIDGDPI